LRPFGWVQGWHGLWVAARWFEGLTTNGGEVNHERIQVRGGRVRGSRLRGKDGVEGGDDGGYAIPQTGFRAFGWTGRKDLRPFGKLRATGLMPGGVAAVYRKGGFGPASGQAGGI